jgi:hypothetical protein
MTKGLFVKASDKNGDFSSNEFSYVTIKFSERNDQSKQKKMISRVLEGLSKVGRLSFINVEAVFPGSEDPDMATLYVAQIQGSETLAVAELKKLDEIQYVSLSKNRRLLETNIN